jgi:hypothetical protein
VAIPPEALAFLGAHELMAIGTSSFTGVPHVSMSIYANDAHAIYFPAGHDELTRQDIADNHWASFTVSELADDHRHVRAVTGHCQCEAVRHPERPAVEHLIVDKLPNAKPEVLTDLYALTPLELHFAEFDYPSDSRPTATRIVSETAARPIPPLALGAELERRVFEPGTLMTRPGEPNSSLFVVLEGTVEIRRGDDAERVTADASSPAQMIGPGAALLDATATESVTALTRTVALRFTRSALQKITRAAATAELERRGTPVRPQTATG